MIKDLSKLHNEVQRNGYLKVADFISKEDAVNLETKTLKAFKKASSKFFHAKTDYVKILSINQEDSKKIRYFRYLNDIFTNHNLTEFIKNYFNSEEVEISKIFLAESSNNGEKVDVLPYKMHFDKTRYLKFMIYLRDVFEGDGGVTFAKKEWNTKLQQELLKREVLQEENVVEVKDLSQIEEITGLKGTAAIFDTNITHKAGQVLGENKRLVLRIDTRIKPT
jgi:hypothetical protein|tara:strand:+ start:207 stop:872 length:666 start_codon:yes stop_codon:yes gene_type:complete